MADQIQLRGGTTAEHSTFTGAAREVTVDTDKNTLVVHDGATAGGKPLLNEADLKGKNLLINGDFQVWQRGTTFSTGNEYTADRWRTNVQNNASRVTTNINAEAAYGLNISNNGTAPSINQPVELDVTGNAGVFQSGSDFTLSLTLKANVAGTIQVRGLFRDISNNSLNQVVCTNTITLNVTTGVQQFNDVLTINAAPNPTNVMMELVIFNSGGIDDFTISQAKLERGSIATPFEYESYGDVLLKCQRYYQFHGPAGVIYAYTSARNEDGRFITFPWFTRMRAAPTVEIVNPVGWSGSPGSGNSNGNMCVITGNATTVDTQAYVSDIIADAEL